MKAFFKSKFGKGYTMAVMALALMLFSATGAFAAVDPGTADQATVDAVHSAFNDVQATALAALAALGGVAILLFAGIYAWRYGKKVFSIIAK